MQKIDLNNFQVATSETARDINSRILLNLVREHQPISRADLMRHSGLQRSTISVITEQLIQDRWLREGGVGRSLRGRRPIFLHLNDDRVGFVGINLQPNTTDVGLANLNGQFVVRETIDTPTSSSKFVNQISHYIHKWVAQYPQMKCEEIGVSLPGRIDPSSHKLVFSPNLHWHSTDLKVQLERVTGLRVSMENATNACVLSEFWFGKHANRMRNIIAITVSEGIGVGLILNGQLIRGASGLAGEFGHVTLNENGPQCACGNKGCWEAYASNLAALRYYKAIVGGKYPVQTFAEFLQLIDQNDLRALEALKYMAEYLGVGIAMLITGLSPDLVTIVGDITRCWSKIQPIVVDVIKKRVSTHAPTKVVVTESCITPRLQGIIALVLQKHFAAPIGI